MRTTLTKDQKRSLIALGKAVRNLRVSNNNMSVATLATLAGINTTSISRIERGQINVRVRTLTRLASALNVSVAKLLDKAGL